MPVTDENQIKLTIGAFALQAVQTRVLNTAEVQTDEPVGAGQLGTPVFSNLQILAGSYIDYDGEKIAYEDITINTVLFDVSMSKNIITTQLVGKRGTVKEYISDGDFVINIRGVLVNEDVNDRRYPQAQVQNLLKILNAPDVIKVTSMFLQNIGIDYVVFTSYQLPQIAGNVNSQPFQISCLSDEAPEVRDV